MKTKALLALVSMLLLPSLAQAVTVSIDPGLYGAYNASDVLITHNGKAGLYSVWSVAANTWVINGAVTYNDVSGVQSPTIAAGDYQIKARDANVVIGAFSIDGGGNIISPSGSISVAGPNISFINHTVNLISDPNWTYPDVRVWDTIWSEFGAAKFVLPAGSWPGYWGQQANSFKFTLASDGTVTVTNQSTNIGLTGGVGQLIIGAKAIPFRYSSPADAPAGNRWALDWGTDNLPNWRGSGIVYLYPGYYTFATSLSAFSPTSLTVPTSPNYDVYTFTNPSYSGSGVFSFTALIPEPTTALLLGLAGAGLVLRRRPRN